jgi:outer membrane protein, adhesin transport system
MLWLVSALPVMALSQTTWNLEQVLDAAVANHPLVQGRRLDESAAKSDNEGAQWQRFPTLSVEASSPNAYNNGNDDPTIKNNNSGSTLVRIDQPLWAGGRITAGIDAANSRLKAASAALAEARQTLSLRAIAAVTEALRQQLKLQHSEAGVKEHEKLLAMIQRRVAQEVSPLADERLAAARLYSTANDLSATKQALNNALTQLSQLTGQTVKAVTDYGLDATGTPQNLDSALQQVLAYSPTLRRLSMEEEIAVADIAVKRSVYMPQLIVRYENSTIGYVSEKRAMLVLTAQTGAGLSAWTGVDAAMARRESARLTKEATERDERERIMLDWNEWEEAKRRLDNANQVRILSAEVSESYARQYVAGRRSWLEVLNAVRESTQAELAMDDASAQFLAVSLRLRALTGTLVGLSGNQP